MLQKILRKTLRILKMPQTTFHKAAVIYYILWVGLFLILMEMGSTAALSSSAWSSASSPRSSVIHCTFKNHHYQHTTNPYPGELLRHPVVTPHRSEHHVRITRENTGEVDDEEEILENNHFYLKHPSFQHKMNNKLSHFHGDNPYSEITYNSVPALYPVASLYVNGDPRSNYKHLIQKPKEPEVKAVRQSAAEEAADLEDDAYTPFISSRVLSNVPMFFRHLHENIQAIQNNPDEDLDSGSISVSDSSSPEEEEERGFRGRGDHHYLQSDGRLSIDIPRDGYQYDTEPDYGDPILERRGGGDGMIRKDPKGFQASRELLAYMGRDPKYKKANNYNPSFLLGMGLGKRSESRNYGKHPKS